VYDTNGNEIEIVDSTGIYNISFGFADLYIKRKNKFQASKLHINNFIKTYTGRSPILPKLL
jgi:hypothetical protein